MLSLQRLGVDIRKSDGVRCVGGREGSVLRQDWVHTDRYGHGHLHCCVTPAPPTPSPWPTEVPGDVSLSRVAVGYFRDSVHAVLPQCQWDWCHSTFLPASLL